MPVRIESPGEKKKEESNLDSLIVSRMRSDKKTYLFQSAETKK